MRELAVPMFMVTIAMTPFMFGLKVLLFYMLSRREPEIYEQLGRPSFLRNRNDAFLKLGHFLWSKQPEQLTDVSTYFIANTLRILIPIYLCTVIPLFYRLIVE